MILLYIKAKDGVYWRPQKAGVQDPELKDGFTKRVCLIKKLCFGRWQIDYDDEYLETWPPRETNTRLIIYPSGIEEIRFIGG